MEFFNRLSFKNRLIAIVVFSLMLCSIVSVTGFLYFNKQELYRGVIEKSRAIHLRLDASVRYVAMQDGLEPVIQRLKQKYTSHESVTKEEKEIVLKQVPIYAAMKIGKMDAEKDNYEFRVFSDEPRNEGNRATAEDMVIFKKFENDPSLNEQVVNVGDHISVFHPVRLTEERGCFKCHGDPATSVWSNGRDVLGYKMENWKDGKLHGVFEIKTDLNKLAAVNSEHISPGSILVAGILLSGAIGVVLAIVLIKRPTDNLNALAMQLDAAGKEVNGEASQIARGGEELSQASIKQASSLQETSASIEEISSMINNNSENCKQATTVSETSMRSTEKGKEVVESMIDAIGEINSSNEGIAQQIDETNKEIESIVKIINEIASKTKVINDIVFQTKLLSFNASVEAARAGEAGKGFAVVAEEVGNLAAMSGNAALEITKMLEESTTTVENIVKNSKEKIERLVRDSKDKVNHGKQIAQECEETFNEILKNINSVSQMIAEVSNASYEQAMGVTEINKAMAQLDQVTQLNTVNANSSAQSAVSLETQANRLNALVNELLLTLNGKA